MSNLKTLAEDLKRYIEVDLKAFNEDYRDTPNDTQSISALNFKKRELEALWMDIDRKFKQMRESPEFNDPEKSATVSLSEIVKGVRSARDFYRTNMISIDESIYAVTRLNETQPSLLDATAVQNTHSVSFNVPPCDMPIFSGEFKFWASFRDLFQAIYGNNTRLSGVEKLFHLKQKTSGEAKEIVDNAPLTNEGFLIAWNQLVAQYENKRMQINAQLKTLFNLPTVNTMCSTSIRKLQRKINCCISNLNSLNIDTDNWDPIFVYLCSTRLPKETRREFEKTLRDCAEMPSWTDLDSFLTNTYKELTSVNDVQDQINHPNPPNKPRFFQEHKNPFDRRGKTFHNVAYSTNDKNLKINRQNEQKFSKVTQNNPRTNKYTNTQNLPTNTNKLDGSITVRNLIPN